MPSALVGQAEISRRLKVSPLTVRRWVREGLVPSADFETRTGRKVWLRPTIEAWFAQASELLETCPDCGARTTSTDRHRGGAHR